MLSNKKQTKSLFFDRLILNFVLLILDLFSIQDRASQRQFIRVFDIPAGR